MEAQVTFKSSYKQWVESHGLWWLGQVVPPSAERPATVQGFTGVWIHICLLSRVWLDLRTSLLYTHNQPSWGQAAKSRSGWKLKPYAVTRRIQNYKKFVNFPKMLFTGYMWNDFDQNPLVFPILPNDMPSIQSLHRETFESFYSLLSLNPHIRSTDQSRHQDSRHSSLNTCRIRSSTLLLASRTAPQCSAVRVTLSAQNRLLYGSDSNPLRVPSSFQVKAQTPK